MLERVSRSPAFTVLLVGAGYPDGGHGACLVPLAIHGKALDLICSFPLDWAHCVGLLEGLK